MIEAGDFLRNPENPAAAADAAATDFYQQVTMLVQERLDGDVTAAANVLKVPVQMVRRWMAGESIPHWQVQDAALRTLRSQGWRNP
jgi:hypothetical protein